MTILTAENITVRFGGVIANDDVSLKLERGKIIGLIGPNGSGKTTLFNALTGYAPIAKGKVTLLGKDITNLPPHKRTRRGLGRTFQIERPFEGLTVLENVLIPAFMIYQNRQDAEDWTFECLERVELEDRAKQLSSDLNLASLRKLELAKAIAVKPRILFLDEVMAGLDSEALEKMRTVITELSVDGISILMIEHSLNPKKIMYKSSGFFSKVIALSSGKKIDEGTLPEVMKNPKVREILGESQIEKEGENDSPSS